MARGILGLALVVLLGGWLAIGPAAAQTQEEAQSVADVRAELDVLNRQVQELRAALVQSGSARGLPSAPATPLVRLDQLEAELRRLIGRVEVLSNDVTRIVNDATNRVGDLEFRLTELEGGDVSLLDRPEPLGGGLTGPATPPPPVAAPETGSVIAAEQAAFDAAVEAAATGDNARAAMLFETFLATFPGGPLTTEAQFRRGEAQAATGEHRSAARSYLDAFSGAPEGELAPRALVRLANSLGELGQVNEACLTLTEVVSRYPGSAEAAQVPGQRQALACP